MGGRGFRNRTGYPLPEIVAPANSRCVLFRIPDEIGHISAFWGALNELGKWVSWARDEDKRAVEVAQTWQRVIAGARATFLAGDCGVEECEETPCEECPPVESGGKNRGGGEAGTLGLTIEELESIVMSTIMGIRWHLGKLQVQYFPCCDWVDVEGNVQVAGESGISNVAKSIAEILGNTELEWPRLPNEPIAPAGHSTEDSVRCAKASAMAETFFTTMSDFGGLIDAVGVSNVTVGAVLGAAAGIFLTGGWALAAAIAVAIVTYLNEDNLNDTEVEMESQTGDAAARTELICNITPKMNGGTVVGTDDFRAMMEAWEDIYSPSGTLKSLMKAIPGGWMRDRMHEKVGELPCGCEQYLPYGYDPDAPPEGAFNYQFQYFTGAVGGAPSEWSDKTLNQPLDAGQLGTGDSISGYVTENQSSGGGWWYAMGLPQFRMSSPIALSQVTFELFPVSSTPDFLQAQVAYFSTDDNRWHHAGNWVFPPNTGGTVTLSVSGTNVTHLIVLTETQNDGGNYVHGKMTNLRIDGTFSGQGFVDLHVGENFAP